MPQELLPTFPPIVQRECVEGSGPKTIPTCGPTLRLTCSLIAPGWQITLALSACASPIAVRYFETSITTAKLTVSPERLVPPPRAGRGGPKGGDARCAATKRARGL